MEIKVCKFGGTSMADGNVIRGVKRIIEDDPSRRFIVVSAPGKRYSDDEKITDLLYDCYEEIKNKGNCDLSFNKVARRFNSIISELNITGLETLLSDTKREIELNPYVDFIASRGEYLSARVLASYLGARFIDSKDVVFFNPDGSLCEEKTYSEISLSVVGASLAVLSGFYGTGADGKIKTFSRGGSDISGAVVARGVGASLYENWTDVSGFLACDPRIVDSPARIKNLSYKELRELSYMGASVLHSESIFPVRKANIPILIKNTFRPQDDGTLISPTSRYIPCGNIVTGIAGKKDFTVIFIEKSLMNGEVGFIRKILSVVENEGVAVEHIPSGIDTLSLVVSSHSLKGGIKERILNGIREQVKPDHLRVLEDIALIVTVGHEMSSTVGTAARLFKAVADAGINIKMIDQGSSEINIVIGVKNEDCDNCIKAIYKEFFKEGGAL